MREFVPLLASPACGGGKEGDGPPLQRIDRDAERLRAGNEPAVVTGKLDCLALAPKKLKRRKVQSVRGTDGNRELVKRAG